MSPAHCVALFAVAQSGRSSPPPSWRRAHVDFISMRRTCKRTSQLASDDASSTRWTAAAACHRHPEPRVRSGGPGRRVAPPTNGLAFDRSLCCWFDLTTRLHSHSDDETGDINADGSLERSRRLSPLLEHSAASQAACVLSTHRVAVRTRRVQRDAISQICGCRNDWRVMISMLSNEVRTHCRNARPAADAHGHFSSSFSNLTESYLLISSRTSRVDHQEDFRQNISNKEACRFSAAPQPAGRSGRGGGPIVRCSVLLRHVDWPRHGRRMLQHS